MSIMRTFSVLHYVYLFLTFEFDELCLIGLVLSQFDKKKKETMNLHVFIHNSVRKMFYIP